MSRSSPVALAWSDSSTFRTRVSQVKQYESNFTIQFDVLDWDKISGNDQIGVATCVLSVLPPIIFCDIDLS